MFSERPGKIINGITYDRGNIPDREIRKLVTGAFEHLKTVSAEQIYNITLKKNFDGSEVFFTSDNPETNRGYKANFELSILQFKNEEEMEMSSVVSQGITDRTFAGLLLFGSNSYAKLNKDKDDEGFSLGANVGAHAYGNDGTNRFHAVLVGATNQNDPGTYTHEIGHNLGLGHITMGDPVTEMPGNKEYNTKGLMKGVSGEPEAPFKSQLMRIINTLKSIITSNEKK